MCAESKIHDRGWRIEADDGRELRVLLKGDEYQFIRLTWPERSAVIQSAVTINTEGVDLAPTQFAHHLLCASVRAVRHGDSMEPVLPEWLDTRPVALGDLLTEVALHINGRHAVTTREVSYTEHDLEIDIGGHIYHLAPWTWGQRNRALQQALASDGDSQLRVNTTRFYRSLLENVVIFINGVPPTTGWLDELPADIGDALIEAALPMAGQDSSAKRRIAQALRERLPDDGVALYTLCREFGWTPDQIRRQRAVDIDTLLAVHNVSQQLARFETPARSAASPAPMANHPTTAKSEDTIILFTDD